MYTIIPLIKGCICSTVLGRYKAVCLTFLSEVRMLHIEIGIDADLLNLFMLCGSTHASVSDGIFAIPTIWSVICAVMLSRAGGC